MKNTGLPPDLTRFANMLHVDSKSRARGAAFAAPIVPTSVYAQAGQPAGDYQYARWSNPGWTALESSLGYLEAAEAVIFPSGSAAIAAAFAACLRPGDLLLLPEDGYMGTRVTAQRYVVPAGVQLHTCPTRSLARMPLESYRLVLIETPSNPGLDIADIAVCAQRIHAGGGILLVDNTLMTPVGQQPLDLGADATVYSDSKLVNGHTDVIFGHVCSRDATLLAGVRDWRRITGAIPGPFETWMVQRGLDTLELRYQRMTHTAHQLAHTLVDQLGAQAVCYPGLATHPQADLARRQMSGGGCLIGLDLQTERRAEAFLGECRYLRESTSFGGIHASAERRARWGDAVSPGFIRLSVGCEPTDAFCREVLRALAVACA
jgi:cystathionine gamma-lyase